MIRIRELIDPIPADQRWIYAWGCVARLRPFVEAWVDDAGVRIVNDALEIMASTSGAPSPESVTTYDRALRSRLEPEPDGTKPNSFTDQILMMAVSSMKPSIQTESGCAWIYNTSQTRWSFVDRTLGTKTTEYEGLWWDHEQTFQRQTLEVLQAGGETTQLFQLLHPEAEINEAIRRISAANNW